MAIINVEIEVAVVVTATLDTDTGAIVFHGTTISEFDGDRQFCLYSEDLARQDEIDNDCGWLSDDDVREHFGEHVLMGADEYVSKQFADATCANCEHINQRYRGDGWSCDDCGEALDA